MHAAKPIVLVILSGGGFTFETRLILQAMKDDVEFVYFATDFGGVPGEHGIPDGEAHGVPTFQTVSHKSVTQSVYAFLSVFIKTIRVLRAGRISSIVGVGCSHAVPMLLAGRIMGKRNIFVESITRVSSLSDTGKLVYKMGLSDLFVVQWPGLRDAHAKSILGTVL